MSLCLGVLGSVGTWLGVSPGVEALEQNEQRDDVHQVSDGDVARVWAAEHQDVDSLCVHQQKLSHLQQGDVILPPCTANIRKKNSMAKTYL